jgi:hypothetical protein
MLVDFVDPKRFYNINEVADVLGLGRDSIIALTKAGEIAAVTLPKMSKGKGRRRKECRRIQGDEIIRFTKKYLGRRPPA